MLDLDTWYICLTDSDWGSTVPVSRFHLIYQSFFLPPDFATSNIHKYKSLASSSSSAAESLMCTPALALHVKISVFQKFRRNWQWPICKYFNTHLSYSTKISWFVVLTLLEEEYYCKSVSFLDHAEWHLLTTTLCVENDKEACSSSLADISLLSWYANYLYVYVFILKFTICLDNLNI